MIARCPSETQLRSYVLGQCDDNESNSIEQHLNECSTCESSAAALDAASDSLLRHLPLAAAESAASDHAPGWLAQLRMGPQAAVATPMEALLEPRDQHSNYELFGVLGRGGMGVVYRGRHRRLNRIVALKVLDPRLLAAEEARRRFEREIRILGSLKHPGIVMATDAGQSGTAAYLVMEYVDGADLSRIVRSIGPLRIAEACEVARQMAEALSAAHEVGAIHRDVKPSNAMIDRTGCVKLLDFGLAFLTTTSENESRTSVGRFLGTLEYMAPEQLDGQDSNTHRTDIYALGATLFFLLTGRPPHATNTHRPLMEQLRTIANAPAPRITQFRADVPAELDEFIARLLSHDPAARPATAREISGVIARWAGGDLRALVAEIPPIDDAPAEAGQPLSQHLEPSDVTDRLPAASSHATDNTDNTDNTLQPRPRVSRRRMIALCVAAAFIAAITWCIIVLIRTPEGTLRIESEVADVRVELVNEDEVAREWTVERGENSTTLRAGRYRVRLASAYDGVTLVPDAVVIRQGEEVIARVSRLDDRAAQKSVRRVPKDQLTTEQQRIYEGQPESVWQQRIRSEQSAIPKLKAAQALLALSATLPPNERMARLIDIGSRIIEAGWGDNHPILAVGNFYDQSTKDGARWPLRRDRDVIAAFETFVAAVNAEVQQIPSGVVAEQLAMSLATGSPHEASFSAWLLEMRHRDLVKDTNASRAIVRGLDVRPRDGILSTYLAVLVRTLFIGQAEQAQREQIIADFHQLASLLLNEGHEGNATQLREAWLKSSRHVPASEWAARLILDEALTLGTSAIEHRFMARWFRDSLPYADAWAHAAREHTAHFRDHWAVVINEYLAEHQSEDVRRHLPAIVLSIDYLTRIQFEDDNWELQRTVELLEPYLQSYYTSNDGELIEQSPEEILPVPISDLLKIRARVTGEIPAFVREGRPRSTTVVKQLEYFERLLSQTRDTAQFMLMSDNLSGLLHVAPYHSMRITVSKHSRLFRTAATDVVYRISDADKENGIVPFIDPLLLLAILTPLTGESEEQDQRITELFLEPNARRRFLRHIEDLLSGSWRMKRTVQQLLRQMAEQTRSEQLRELITSLSPELSIPDEESPE